MKGVAVSDCTRRQVGRGAILGKPGGMDAPAPGPHGGRELSCSSGPSIRVLRRPAPAEDPVCDFSGLTTGLSASHSSIALHPRVHKSTRAVFWESPNSEKTLPQLADALEPQWAPVSQGGGGGGLRGGTGGDPPYPLTLGEESALWYPFGLVALTRCSPPDRQLEWVLDLRL